jgi:hypothetical protein
MPIYDDLQISHLELVDMLAFSESLGQDYTGWWIVKERCPWRIYSPIRFIDGPPCVGIVIEVLDASGNESPEIGGLNVQFLATGDVRNFPAQSAPTLARSQPITGDWGITIPYVKQFFGTDTGGDQIYGDGDIIIIQFSELTDKSLMVSAQLDKETLDKLLEFDQRLGDDYEGRWLAPDLIRVRQ